MPINPWFVSQTAPAWSEQLLTDSGTANLTGISPSNVSIIFKNISNGQETTATGTVTIPSGTAAQGILNFQPSTADAANPGLYQTTVWVVFANGPQPFDLGIWNVLAK